MKGCITERKHHLAKAAEHRFNALPGRKKCAEHFFLNLSFVGPAKPFNLGIGAEQLVHHHTEQVGDTDSTSQELKSGICATLKLACGSWPKGAQLEFLAPFLESTSQAVA